LGRTLYLDCFSGASGDMVVGALIDLGLPIDGLRAALGSLAIDYGGVSTERVLRAGVSASRFRVHAEEARLAAHAHPHDHSHPQDHAHPHDHAHPQDHAHPHDHHSLKEIAGYVARSALSPAGRDRAMHMFERLAAAEAAIHAMPIEQVHLHEVGAVDSIIDIVSAVHGMEWVGADEVLASPLNVGGGTVRCAHGTFPVPAPATARLLEGVPVYSGEVAMELVTPTGAVIVTEYASGYQRLPAMIVSATGYGAGTRDVPGHPNVLRMWLGETAGAAPAETVLRIECEIDDMNPQLFGPLMDRLAEAGALDVFYIPVQMKKNRPGTLVTVLAPPARREAIAGLLFAETTTIGIRYDEMRRDVLDREIKTIDTAIGPVRVKVASRNGRVLNAAPEFDDCARLARECGLPIKDVQALALKAWLDS
jgi:pyridinium-3,5-bisthiocarboxylic acid mononucleotide nickel chelatase